MNLRPIFILSVLAFAIALLAWTPWHGRPSAATAAGQQGSASGGAWHVVAPGDDLRSIARHWYGSTRQWRTIQTANGVGMHPPVGVRLWIPAALPTLLLDLTGQ